jgi:ferredoxin-NADP reductase
MKLVVIEKRPLTRAVIQLRLGHSTGSDLPAFEAGAHLELHFPGMTRRYSLTSPPGDRSAYEIAVLRATNGRGGSAFIHDVLSVGDEIECDGPFNTFQMADRPPYVVFVAGGIGITPFYTMVRACLDAGVPYELHYVTRTKDERLPVQALGTGNVFTYVSRDRSDGSPPLDVPSLLERVRRDAHLYVCGPQRMIDMVRSAASRLGWPGAAVHAESFGSSIRPDDGSIVVHLTVSGVTLQVEPGGSILQSMLDAGIWASYGCQRGECGSCYVQVVNGLVDHRDVCLSAAQRQAGMCPCVSWATSGELTIEA